MTDTTPAAGGLTESEVEQHVCCVKPGRCKDEDHFHQRSVERIIAARTEAADREAARVTAEYDALAAAAGNTADDVERYFLAWQSARRRAADLRAALSSTGSDALERERAKAAAEALREAADAAEVRGSGVREDTGDWLRDRAAASTHPDTRPPLPAGAEPGF